ncbi:hypothetical protein CN353_26590 [Bacillus cereus]|uniref:metallophosphoesterase n=1 Tax=Bacillus cereus TaxID=1396 RepID=UPI000BF7700B|nr:metallophosphoesterase [Bacillus cereus]PEY88610.1 hypothetical protein CN353_26590 [Bacillus cereus]PGV94111.1 hypothetical protein COD80_17005 [Bacillus cereus]PGY22216.1 hypothetical protein COE27_29575 [Bacillus cereus]
MKTSNKINKEKSDIIRSLVITSDPQYPWTPKMDEPGGSNESDEEKKRTSENLIREQYRDIQSYILSGNIHGSIIINGDITAYGHTWQRNKMNQIFDEELLVHYFYGLGNHDIENNIDDCFANECTGGSLSTYVNHVQKIPDRFLDEMDITIKGIATQRYYEGCFAYSIILGDIYSIQLNNYPTMELNIRNGPNRYFKMESTLDWLEKVLKKATSLRKIIIVNVHKPNGWKSERFTKLMKQYGVVAVFAGHYHRTLGLQSYEENFGRIPVFLSGSASQRSYLILEQTLESLNVYSVEENNWKKRKLQKSIKLIPTITGTYKIKTALNDTSGLEVLKTHNSDEDWEVYLKGDHHLSSIQWDFKYDRNQNAFQIHSVTEPTKVLAWNDYNGSKNVFVTKNESKKEHYWILEDVGDNLYIIKNFKNRDFVLTVKDGNTSDFTEILVHSRNGTNAQKFRLKPILLKNEYTIRTALNDARCMEVSVNGVKSVYLNTISESPKVLWKFHYDVNKGVYQISNSYFKNEVLSWNNSWNNSLEENNVFVTKNEYKKEQYWYLEDIGNDYYFIQNYKNANAALEVKPKSTNGYTNIQVNASNQTNAQRFKIANRFLDPWT